MGQQLTDDVGNEAKKFDNKQIKIAKGHFDSNQPKGQGMTIVFFLFWF